MSAATRLEAIALRAAIRRLDPDLLGRFVRQFTHSGRLPDSPADLGRTHPAPADVVLVEQLRSAVLDLEEAAFIAAGGDPNGHWCRLLDGAREGRPGADELLRLHAAGHFGRWPGVFGQLVAGYDGCCAIAVVHPPEPEPEAPPAPASAPRRRKQREEGATA